MVLAAKPDLILDFGSVRDTYVSLADRVQAQTGIPYVLIDGRFANTAGALRLPARLLGVPERGERARAPMPKRPSPRSTRALANVPPEQAAAGLSGARARTGSRPGCAARSTPRSSSASAASTSPRRPARGGIANVSLEQVMAWNPDIDHHPRPRASSSACRPSRAGPGARGARGPGLSEPRPALRLDRRAAVAQPVIGLAGWPALFYPEHAGGDLRDDTRGFYQLFYHVTSTDARARPAARWAAPRPMTAPVAALPAPLAAGGSCCWRAAALVARALIGPYPLSPADCSRASAAAR